MVRVGTVWDSALEAVRGRAGMIVPVAALTLFGPSVVQAAMQAYLADPAAGVGRAGLLMLVSLALMFVTFWGALAITAITSHPDTTRADAGRQASARLLPLLGVSLVLGAALTLAVIPVFGVLAASGVDLAAMGQPGADVGGRLGGGGAAFLAFYMLLLLALFVWLFGRLLPLVPTVLHERLGLRAIGRAFRLTRGMGGRLAGLLILFGVVIAVASGAAQLVFGLVFRLVLGADNIATATFLGGVAGAVVSAALSVLAYAFAARLYVMLTGRHLAEVFGDGSAPA